ncbi:MAG: SMC family ATPase [Desulfitobacterium hafniense]|nr:SMC family ATPase [Desulfitobacterium hafniense]
MRPLKLTMSAFGPYAEIQILDFGELNERTFFLIHGPTGSGKTTILDAICFALYGDTSGALRDGKSMRSDHAELSVPTEVEFEFSLGEQIYKVKRWPEQERPKKRGEGVTILSGNAILWQLNPNTGLLTEGWQDVTRKVESIIGFKSSQFRQVVLLPQGDFKKLLTANSSERQEIMQTLFKTELYKQLEEQLKFRSSEVKRTYEQLTKQRSWLLEEASVSSGAELESQTNLKQTELLSLAEQAERLRMDLRKAQDLLTTGKINESKLNEKTQAESALQELEQKLPLVEQYRQELSRALSALNLLDLETVIVQNSNELKEFDSNLNTTLAKLSESKVILAGAEQKLTEEEDRESLRSEIAAKINYLNEISSKIDALKDLETRIRALRTSAELSEAKRTALASELQTIKVTLEQETTRSFTLLELSQSMSHFRSEVEKLQTAIQQTTNLNNLKNQLISQGNLLNSHEKTLTNLNAFYLKGKAELTALQLQWNNGQASILAKTLSPGQPCPVCGSKHHPVPAALSEEVPTEEDLKRKEQLLTRLEKDRDKAQSEYNKLTVERDTTLNRITDLEASLRLILRPNLGNLSLVNSLEQGEIGEIAELGELAEQLKSAELNYDQAVAGDEEYKLLTTRLTKLKNSEQESTQRLEAANQEWQSNLQSLTSLEAVLTDRLTGIPEEYRDSGRFAKTLSDTQRFQIELKKSLDQAQQAAQRAKQQVIQLETTLENLKTNIASKTQAMEALRQRFEQKLTEAGFDNLQDYESAKKDPPFVKKLQDRIQAFDGNLISARERLLRAIEAALGLSMPNLTELQIKLELVQTEYSETLSRLTSLKEQIERERNWLSSLQKIETDIKQAEESYAVIGRLAEVANGNNEFKLTFQRFVLGALLDDVVIAANERLKTMSRGRYYLQRTMDRIRKNAAGGLDLEVFDNHTGLARSVNTLSGGETFLASLSLALGLADVVQSYSGGIHLDTIFIDEGFGTLDPETLDFAIRALIDLQKGGRLVGIISHVPELKERIDARLEIRSTLKGSSASFKLN